MVEPVILMLIITSASACIISVFTHIKHSSCFKNLLEIDTYSPPPITPITPILNNKLLLKK